MRTKIGIYFFFKKLSYKYIIIYFAVKITTLTRFANGYMNCSPTSSIRKSKKKPKETQPVEEHDQQKVRNFIITLVLYS